MPDRFEQSPWHLDKRVNVGHLVTTIMLAGSIFLWGANLEKKVEINTQSQIYLKEQQSQDRDRFERRLGEIRDDVKGVADKIDRVLEKLN